MSKKPPAGSWTFAYQTEQPEDPLFILHVDAKEMLFLAEGIVTSDVLERVRDTLKKVDGDCGTSWREAAWHIEMNLEYEKPL